MGLLICYDVEYPEAVRSVALLGADVVLVPTALTHEYSVVPDYIVPARAVENQVFVAYCNHAGVENGMRFLGGSLLADIDGKAIAAAGAGDALIIGEISQARRLAAAKCFPYRADRRPELYAQLTSKLRRAVLGQRLVHCSAVVRARVRCCFLSTPVRRA